jgi:hypothetical protein
MYYSFDKSGERAMRGNYRKGCALACLLAVGAGTASCVTDPKKVQVQYGNEQSMTCQQLGNSLEEARYYLNAAKKEDRFKFSYIFLPTGVISAYNVAAAKSAAQKRVDYLTVIMQSKGCYTGPQFGSFLEDVLTPTFNQGSLNRANAALDKEYRVPTETMKFGRRSYGSARPHSPSHDGRPLGGAPLMGMSAYSDAPAFTW